MKTENLYVTKLKLKELATELGEDTAMFVKIYRDEEINAWKVDWRPKP